jgi:D-alanyl-D-alanine carboxypeptidase (penicillin-binding protein 5/6)
VIRTEENRYSALTEKEWEARRARRREKRRQRARRRRIRLMTCGFAGAAVLTLLIFTVVHLTGNASAKADQPAESPAAASAAAPEPMPVQTAEPPYSVEKNADTLQLTDEIQSSYAVFIDLSSSTILGEKGADTKISPASMTKILTVLVAAEQIEDLDDTYTVPVEITDLCYRNDCSAAGFLSGETVTVRDLFYGTILPSGADAAMSLAAYTAGSQEAFAALMNEKLDELGLSDTAHFTNCVGIYDEAHYCTVEDMALILKAAEENTLCREVLSAHTYTTSKTEQHPDGILLSNWFLRRIEDKNTGGVTVLCAKTGYVTQSGNCAASYGEDAAGNGYLCVTGNAWSSWRCIYDHVALYQKFAG